MPKSLYSRSWKMIFMPLIRGAVGVFVVLLLCKLDARAQTHPSAPENSVSSETTRLAERWRELERREQELLGVYFSAHQNEMTRASELAQTLVADAQQLVSPSSNPDHVLALVRYQSLLAEIYSFQGQLDAAIREQQQVYDRCCRHFADSDDPIHAGRVALAAASMAHYVRPPEKRLEWADRAIELQGALKSEVSVIARIYAAQIYMSQNKLALAVTQSDRAFDHIVARRLPEAVTYETADELNICCGLLISLQDVRRAREIAEMAVPVCEKLPATTRLPHLFIALFQLGDCCIRQVERQTGIAHLQRAYYLAEDFPEHSWPAALSLSRAYRLKGEFHLSKEWLDRITSPAPGVLWESAALHLALGRIDQARQDYMKLSQSGLPKRKLFYANLGLAQVELAAGSPRQAREACKAALDIQYDLQIQTLPRATLGIAVVNAETAWKTMDTLMPATCEETAPEAVRATYQLIARQRGLVIRGIRTRRQLELERQIVTPDRIRQQLQDAEDVRGGLRDRELMIDFVRYSNDQQQSYAVFLVGPNSVRRVELDQAGEIDETITQWRARIAEGKYGDTLARQLHDKLWKPLAALVSSNVDTIYISSDGMLGLLPWGALLNSSDNQILLEKYAFASCPFPQALLERGASVSNSSLNSVLAVGNLDYGIPESSNGRSEPGKRQAWQPLPDTRFELEALKKQVVQRSLPHVVLQAGEATAQRLKEELQRSQWALIATHGLSSADGRPGHWYDSKGFLDFNSVGLAGLVLSNANVSNRPSEQILDGETISDLDLRRLELAVLSSCNTGLGDLRGGDGIYGLQRAFHVAGAKNVICSLWQVEDTSTSVLMWKFCEKYLAEGHSSLQALRHAQLEVYRDPMLVDRMRELRGGADAFDRKFPELRNVSPPQFWAGFIFSGIEFSRSDTRPN